MEMKKPADGPLLSSRQGVGDVYDEKGKDEEVDMDENGNEA